MPATDINWSLNQPVVPVYQVFRTKRKNEFNHDAYTDVPEGHPKRQCVDTTAPSHGERLFNNHCVGTDQSHMETVEHMTDETVHYSHTQPSDLDTRLTTFPTEASINNTNNCFMEENNNNNSTQSCNQGEMIMDLMDECYSTATLPEHFVPTPIQPAQTLTDAEYEAACYMMSAMDGEGAPDPYQYGVQHSSDVPCCGSSGSSPGRFSSQGRQSLDNLQPYVSDVY